MSLPDACDFTHLWKQCGLCGAFKAFCVTVIRTFWTLQLEQAQQNRARTVQLSQIDGALKK
eukprot:7543-Amphidinium_carterae.1